MKGSPISYPPVNRSIFYIVLSFLIVACGGGNDEIAPTDNSLQSTLSGNIITIGVKTNGENKLLKMDMATGGFSELEKIKLDDGKSHQYYITPATFVGDESILMITSCPKSDQCIVTLDKFGNQTDSFVETGNIVSDVKLSRDYRYLAYVKQRENSSVSSNSYLEIFDRNGNLVSTDMVHDNLVRVDLDWLPDGRIAYIKNSDDIGTIYFTSAYDAKVNDQLSLPEGIEGRIKNISVNPDGNRFVFELIETENIATTDSASIWTVNIDGTNLKKLATSPYKNSKNTKINHPKWSPDGQWILVEYGGAINIPAGAFKVGSLPFLFAIPSDGDNVPIAPFDDSIETAAIHIRSYWRDAIEGAAQNNPDDDWHDSMGYDWIQ